MFLFRAFLVCVGRGLHKLPRMTRLAAPAVGESRQLSGGQLAVRTARSLAVATLAMALGACTVVADRPEADEAAAQQTEAYTHPTSGGQSVVTVPEISGNPLRGRKVHVPDDSQAWAAAAAAESSRDAHLLTRLAQVPTAVWLLPEQHPIGSVGSYVADIVLTAHGRNELPVFVVYGIPDRDCISGYSQGGLPEADYLTWVREIVHGAGRGAVAILEPDALSSVERCSDRQGRISLLAEVVEIMSGGPITYVDAGHSRWASSATTAQRLREVGVGRVRGFALNVANHLFEQEQRAHGERIADELGGAHFVVDTGRSGAGSTGEWCNPAGRALGQLPGPTPGDGAMDGRLWIKPPGESDGTCAGGPVAGTFWDERALELARAAGW